jgi:hypothetical protein
MKDSLKLTELRTAINAMLGWQSTSGVSTAIIPVLPIIELIAEYALPDTTITVALTEFNPDSRMVLLPSSSSSSSSDRLCLIDRLANRVQLYVLSSSSSSSSAHRSLSASWIIPPSFVSGTVRCVIHCPLLHSSVPEPDRLLHLYVATGCSFHSLKLSETNGVVESRHLSGHLSLRGCHDGTANESRFRLLSALALSQDQTTLYACDTGNDRLTAVNTTTGTTRTVCTFQYSGPVACDWDRATNVQPFTYMYVGRSHAVDRVHVATGDITVCIPNNKKAFGGNEIICLPGSGKLIINSLVDSSLFVIDPRDRPPHLRRLTRSSSTKKQRLQSIPLAREWPDLQSVEPSGMCLNPHDRSLFLFDGGGSPCIFRCPLPEDLFV